MHDDIKKFLLHGEMSDSNVVQTKERLVEAVEADMRDQGFAPVLDMEPQFTMDYVEHRGKFNFSLTVYGSYVGRDDSWHTAGVMAGKKIPKFTPATK